MFRQLDVRTCTARDIIENVLLQCPSVFADMMADVAKTHRKAADSMGDHTAVAIASRMSGKAYEVATAARACIADSVLSDILSDTDKMHMAFKVACDLQVVPRSIRGDIIARVPA